MFVCSLNIFDDLFWWEAPQPRESNQVMTEDAAHQTKGNERDWMENEMMNLRRTGGVKHEMAAQGMCNTSRRAKGDEEDSTRCLRCSTSQELFVCLFGERHSCPSNSMSCVSVVVVCSHSPSFLCCAHIMWCWYSPELLVNAQTMLVCRRGIRGIPRTERGNTISMDMEPDTMGCERIPSGVRK